MTITDYERESLRQHLGYGSIIDATPYTPDGFQPIFDLIQAHLTTGPETSCASAIIKGIAIVTPASMTGIVPRAQLVVDVGDDCEIVTVAAVTTSTFSARFALAHAAGCQLAVQSGTARLRMLLHRADQAQQALNDPSVGATSGLASVDKNDVVWQERGAVLRDRKAHYRAIQQQVSTLVRVPLLESGGAQLISLY